ncbi:putative nucleic acid-binding protein, contains PIN domain [Candidatus Nitrososphaera evergladensis SR1]|uniref:Putative nucleic acid-binding protein, contains PIN domain n=1 Tax=Candidatus Nitrososphaera evergladensis SR1 TaxID=1459636 RepID=A0A075MLJ5_9ARCH|nr:type II toxin-antitoxin system VapC family toxin [Candidatus Nitrososphaera evergladensis]AIF82336.1 putative nucleic acid-binding protein, contains PIN domain [Candidatus Nitrososphaera evergladensis SR1]
MERSKKIVAPIVVVVADASVIVKWFVDEENTENALALRQLYIDGKVEIAVPHLLPYEVLNALRYNPEFGEEQVKIASKALEKYQLWLYPVLGDLAALCVQNSFAYGISLYDSSYISLAEYLDATLYTADERILAKVVMMKGKGENFRHISDLKI